MEPSEVIAAYRNPASEQSLLRLRTYFSFKPIGALDETGEDANLDFRTKLTEALLNDFSLADIRLIREMFRAELDCERTVWRHDNLYQLSFYLYSLGQLEDTFVLYESKYILRHMDACTMQDQHFVTVGHEPNIVINYVESCFSNNPNLREDYAGLIKVLKNLCDDQQHATVEEYTRAIRGYFFGHDDDESGQAATASPTLPRKPWWRFW